MKTARDLIRKIEILEQRTSSVKRHLVYWPEKNGQTFEEFCRENKITAADKVHRISWMKA